ncbi:MAG: hypothetical protein ACTHMT_05765 [Verrucomicrobiota bacterium]
MKTLNPLTLSRLRIAQRALIAASDLDPELLADPYWQKAMVNTAATIAEGDSKTPRHKIKQFKALASAAQ